MKMNLIQKVRKHLALAYGKLFTPKRVEGDCTGCEYLYICCGNCIHLFNGKCTIWYKRPVGCYSFPANKFQVRIAGIPYCKLVDKNAVHSKEA